MFSDDESADFISYIYPERVSEMIWNENEKDDLKGELVTAFNELRQFLSVMNDNHKGIIVSIF